MDTKRDADPSTESTGPAVEEEPVIAVGIDGSEGSSAALAWAAREARLRGATLRVVQAWHLPAMDYAGAGYLPAVATNGFSEDVAAALHAQVAQVLGTEPPVPLEVEVVEGPAAQVLLDAAKGAEMVVVGSHGRGGFAGLLLGSVSNQVAHHAHCPVVIVRA